MGRHILKSVTHAEIEAAVAWLRKNDVEDHDGEACKRIADLLEARLRKSRSRVSDAKIIAALEAGGIRFE